jgi:carbon monoxide dehydrogenase subunit G
VKLEHSFDVAAPLERVWRALIDVEYVAPCLPGAAITGRDESGDYRGTFTIKLGPTTAAYNGVLRIGEIDEEAHRATLHARGTDKRGQGAADATIVNTVTATGPEATHVEAVTDFTITGRLARFGRGGMVEDISNRLLGEFARCLAERLAAEPEAVEPVAEHEAVAEPEPEAVAEPEPEPEAALEPEPEPPSPPPPPAEPWISAPPLTEPLPTADSEPAPEPLPLEEPAAVEETAVADAPPAPEPPPPPAPEPPRPPAPRTGSIPPPSAPPPPPPPRQAAPPAAAPVKGFSLFFSVLWERIRRRVRGGRKAQ